MREKIETLIEVLKQEGHKISLDRKEQLKDLAILIRNQIAKSNCSKINFVCTHNSRRSQIAEVMLRSALKYRDIENVECYSSGTETTACNPRTIRAFEQTGFGIDVIVKGDNPVYSISSENTPDTQHLIFSKTYDNPYNPSKDFIAAMVCGDADENCPFIPGAIRFSLTYEDPKYSDGTAEEEKVYLNKIIEIGREMVYLSYEL